MGFDAVCKSLKLGPEKSREISWARFLFDLRLIDTMPHIRRDKTSNPIAKEIAIGPKRFVSVPESVIEDKLVEQEDDEGSTRVLLVISVELVIGTDDNSEIEEILIENVDAERLSRILPDKESVIEDRLVEYEEERGRRATVVWTEGLVEYEEERGRRVTVVWTEGLVDLAVELEYCLYLNVIEYIVMLMFGLNVNAI